MASDLVRDRHDMEQVRVFGVELIERGAVDVPAASHVHPDAVAHRTVDRAFALTGFEQVASAVEQCPHLIRSSSSAHPAHAHPPTPHHPHSPHPCVDTPTPPPTCAEPAAGAE
ncbi:hypothetical protein MTS1_01019 [Microbacterium sp. TS-1]|nr:hypothetical protein MTS1_01019 [Microbacterium sp. TS-1]